MSVFGIEDIYEGVIKDVLEQTREIFLDEGVDIDVMKMLKESWEEKITESGVLKVEQPQKVKKSKPKVPSSIPIELPPLPTQIQPNDHSSQHQKVVSQIDGNKLPLPSYHRISGVPYIVKVNQQENEEDIHSGETQKKSRVRKRRIPQLDGGGVGMTDSSSEEEEEEEQIDKIPIKKEEVEEENDQNGNEEEEPLNSDDDLQSEDEGEETVFESENVVVCQYQKILRKRPNKWKFEFKDGIMHINGKDHCFHKLAGEAEF